MNAKLVRKYSLINIPANCVGKFAKLKLLKLRK